MSHGRPYGFPAVAGMVVLFGLLVLSVTRWNVQPAPASEPKVQPEATKTDGPPTMSGIQPDSSLATAIGQALESSGTTLQLQPSVASLGGPAPLDVTKDAELPTFDIALDADYLKSREEALSEPIPPSTPVPAPAVRSPAMSKIFRELQSRPILKEAPKSAPTTVSDALKVAPVNEPEKDAVAWPDSPRLNAALASLKHPRCADWAQRVQGDVDALRTANSLRNPTTAKALQELSALVREARDIASRLEPSTDRTQLMAASYALRKRIDLWQAAVIAAHEAVESQAIAIAQSVDRRRMLAIIDAVRETIGTTSHANAWRQFLLLDELQQVAITSQVLELKQRYPIATRALKRFSAENASEKQLEFFAKTPLQDLQRELRVWTTHPVPMHELLVAVERFEKSPYEKSANKLTQFWNALKWSAVPEYAKLATVIDTHYRNANLRISASEQFINRLIPAMRNVRSPIRDQILGADVTGLSKSDMHFRVDLLEDNDRIRMNLKAQGHMAANTQATKGSVTMHNHNRSRFMIEKMFVMSDQGIRTGPAKAAAQGDLSLVGMQTRFDTLPVVGMLVRRVAKQRAFENRGLYRRIFENRVAAKARNQIDSQVSRELGTTSDRLENRVIQPLQEMGLDPKTITMSTTDERAHYRGRLAGENQLAAFTARPTATLNNVVSVQVHNSAINNFLRQLELDGMEGELAQVVDDILQQLGIKDYEFPDPIPEGVQIRLAKSDSIRIDCEDGKLGITIRIAQLKTRREQWKSFVVRAFYEPQTKGFQCDLMRQDCIQLMGKRLSFGDQVALRTIFTKVFSKSRPIPLIHPDLTNDERLADLYIDQFDARDGWLGISVGQQQLAATAKAPQSGKASRRR